VLSPRSQLGSNVTVGRQLHPHRDVPDGALALSLTPQRSKPTGLVLRLGRHVGKLAQAGGSGAPGPRPGLAFEQQLITWGLSIAAAGRGPGSGVATRTCPGKVGCTAPPGPRVVPSRRITRPSRPSSAGQRSRSSGEGEAVGAEFRASFPARPKRRPLLAGQPGVRGGHHRLQVRRCSGSHEQVDPGVCRRPLRLAWQGRAQVSQSYRRKTPGGLHRHVCQQQIAVVVRPPPAAGRSLGRCDQACGVRAPVPVGRGRAAVPVPGLAVTKARATRRTAPVHDLGRGLLKQGIARPGSPTATGPHRRR